ncbi:MAG: hypothetical protein R3288_02910 [Woeseiaceae bacterium]|nr:hypothetical protein [Woeseiaceae bacterium]
MWKKNSVLAGSIAAALALSPAAVADDDDDEDVEIPFDVAEIFFELNNTDGDLGIHALIDGEPWKRLRIEGVRDRKLLNIFLRSRLRRQGLTELFFESAEPPFDELAPEDFFARFPEGTYEVEGRTLDGEELESETELTHAMPAPAEPTVNGYPLVEICDDEDPEFVEPEPVAGPGEAVIISWPAVTRTHPDLGSPRNSGDIVIVNYEVVVETDLEIDGEEFTTVISVIVPPDVRSMTVPAEFLAQSDEFKYEVLAREESWNQTAVESCFLIDGD